MKCPQLNPLAAALFLAMAAVALAAPRTATAEQATLTLDSMSFISFQEHEWLLLPAGSKIRFSFGQPDSSGAIPFTIDPNDIAIPPVDVPSLGKELHYGLSSLATGVVRPSGDGRIIEFTGMVKATLSGADGGSFIYPIDFTTETVSATDAIGSLDVEVTGLRLIENVWYAQIVGATTNHENAFPEPGAAVYTVLSGQFDQLPISTD